MKKLFTKAWRWLTRTAIVPSIDKELEKRYPPPPPPPPADRDPGS